MISLVYMSPTPRLQSEIYVTNQTKTTNPPLCLSILVSCYCQTDTSWSHIGRGNLNWRIARCPCHWKNALINDGCGSAQTTVGGTIPGQGVCGFLRKLAEPGPGNEPLSSIPVWVLLYFLFELLAWLLSAIDCALRSVSQIIPVLPYVSFGQNVSSQQEKPKRSPLVHFCQGNCAMKLDRKIRNSSRSSWTSVTL